MTKKAVAAFTVVALLSSVAFARLIMWPPDEKPKMSINQALVLAQETLDKSVGKDQAEFYCTNAMLAISSSPNGDWTFTFSSKDKGSRWIVVWFNGKTEISNHSLNY